LRHGMIGRFVTWGQSVAIGDKHFEVVKEFVYLGYLITPTNDVSQELQRRIQTANRCFFGLRNQLRREKNQLLVFGRKVL
jgi:hypothetical protein